jgi:hypothetical protein
VFIKQTALVSTGERMSRKQIANQSDEARGQRGRSGEYAWQCIEDGQLITIDVAPAVGKEKAPHRFTLLSSEDGQQVFEYFGQWLYLGEV